MNTTALIRSLLALTKSDPRVRHHRVVLDHGCCAGALVSVSATEGRVVLHGESGGAALNVKETVVALRALGAGTSPTLMVGGCSNGEVGAIAPRRKEVLLVLA